MFGVPVMESVISERLARSGDNCNGVSVDRLGVVALREVAQVQEPEPGAALHDGEDGGPAERPQDVQRLPYTHNMKASTS